MKRLRMSFIVGLLIAGVWGCIAFVGWLRPMGVVLDLRGGRVVGVAKDGSANALWLNGCDGCASGSDADESADGNAHLEWENLGGARCWIGPSGRWKEIWGAGWPPPRFFDGDAWEISDEMGSETVLLSPQDAVTGMRIRRVVRRERDGFTVRSRIENLPSETPWPSGFFPWEIIQIPFTTNISWATSVRAPCAPVPSDILPDVGAATNNLAAAVFEAPLPDARRIRIEQLSGSATNLAQKITGSIYFSGDQDYTELEFRGTPVDGWLEVRVRILD